MHERIRHLNQIPFDVKSYAERSPRYVLYWMQVYKRLEYNHAFTHAKELAKQAKLPVLVYEGLRLGYPWASDRFHSFILEGAIDTARHAARHGIPYVFYLERSKPKKGKPTILTALAEHAAAVVTDDSPCFIVPQQSAKLASRVTCPVIAVDSNGIVPLSKMTKEEYAARTIRPKIHRVQPEYLVPYEDVKWKAPKLDLGFVADLPDSEGVITNFDKLDIEKTLSKLSIDHSVAPSPRFRGGRQAGLKKLKEFVTQKLASYDTDRNDPAIDGTSELSPYLHFGFVSPLEVALAAMDHHTERTLGTQAFLEELIVRRELSFNFTKFNPHYDKYEGLPNWAIKSLAKHERDKRPFLYTLADFENARTHDELWNAAQRELVTTGKMHGYVRMYWGKMMLFWSKTPQQAFEWCVHLNNKYALDGRDPNSYAGIHWCFGKHDRPWGPERPVFGLVRYMTLDGMKRKFDVAAYVKRWSR